jgi:hypothetical protein
VILAVNELYTTTYQTLTTDHHNKQLVTLRPHLYRHGSPAGTVTLQIQDNAGSVLASSNTRSIASIGTGTYWHGYANFDVSFMLAKSTTYRVAIVASSYTFSPTAYVGWCGGYDLGKYPHSYTTGSKFDYPLDLEIFTRQQVKKGIA